MEISEIKKHLSAEIVGEKLFVYDEVGSTNDLLRELMGDGLAADGTVVVSDSQTAGRGRLGRKWVSPAGRNLHLSALFRPEISPQKSSVFTFLASCALVEVFSGYGVDATIKWPNDILVDGKKISGVLTELGTSAGSVDYLVIGIGVNLNLPEEFIHREMDDISEKTTSLSILLGEKVSRERFCAELIGALDRLYGEFRRRGTQAIVDMWIERWGFLGKEISVDVSGEVISGLVERVDGNGFLYLRTDKGDLRRVVTGDTVF
jgi:BirA family biotin operon repressor/biotin-[acetyl-CoA-carboxylase] ligase